jgi:hypothetical protein
MAVVIKKAEKVVLPDPYLPSKVFTKDALRASYAEYEGLTYAQIDSLLVEKMMQGIKEQDVPDTVLSDKNRKWRAISAYQKAVRRQDLPVALRAGSAVYRSEASYFMRRMAVVMFEDVGLANLQLCALSLAIQNNMKWVRANGCIQIPMYLTKIAATNPTDRTLCEIAVYSKRSPDYLDFRKKCWELADSNPHELSSYVMGDDPIKAYLATLALSGGLKIDDMASVPSNSIFTQSIEAVQELPNLIKYCIIKASRLGLEGLPTALHANWMSFTDAEVVERELPPAPLIAGLPSVAYDKHVLEGKKAIGYFCKSCKPVQEFIETQGITNKVDAVGSAIFEEEAGNVLRESLVYPFQQKMLAKARQAHMYSCGLGEEGDALCAIVANNFDSLNEARRKVIG